MNKDFHQNFCINIRKRKWITYREEASSMRYVHIRDLGLSSLSLWNIHLYSNVELAINKKHFTSISLKLHTIERGYTNLAGAIEHMN